MSFTPEGRQKALATKARKKAERLAAAQSAAAEVPQTLADIGLAAEVEDEFRFDDILTNEEIELIKARAEKEVADEERKKRARSFLDAAKEEARRNRGLMPVDEARQHELEEMTEIRINLPRHRTANGREIPPDPIRIDQHSFFHGKTYPVTRAQYEYLLDRCFQAWQHMAQVEGRSRTYYSDTLGFNISFNGYGPAVGGAFGPSFDALHRRPS